jgi:hypothetical protein
MQIRSYKSVSNLVVSFEHTQFTKSDQCYLPVTDVDSSQLLAQSKMIMIKGKRQFKNKSTI